MLGLVEMVIALVTDSAYLLLGVTARERLGGAAARHVNPGRRRDPDRGRPVACLAA
jgi:hypothetical protein